VPGSRARVPGSRCQGPGARVPVPGSRCQGPAVPGSRPMILRPAVVQAKVWKRETKPRSQDTHPAYGYLDYLESQLPITSILCAMPMLTMLTDFGLKSFTCERS
jgi:hypothetical protein